MKLKQRIAKLKRDIAPPDDQPIVLVEIEGNPDAAKFGMVSNREAMIGDVHYRADPAEPTPNFHARLKRTYRELGARGCIMLGHPSNAEAPKGSTYSPAGAPPTGSAEAPATTIH